MAQITVEVKTYAVWLGPALHFSTLPIAYPALIICECEGDFRATFRFVEADPLPASVFNSDTHAANIFVHSAQYPWYVDILRNEQPVYCRIDTATPGNTYLLTDQEPVGEGEVAVRV